MKPQRSDSSLYTIREQRNLLTRMTTNEFIWFWAVFIMILACVCLTGIVFTMVVQEEKKFVFSKGFHVQSKTLFSDEDVFDLMWAEDSIISLSDGCYATAISKKQFITMHPCGQNLTTVEVNQEIFKVASVKTSMVDSAEYPNFQMTLVTTANESSKVVPLKKPGFQSHFEYVGIGVLQYFLQEVEIDTLMVYFADPKYCIEKLKGSIKIPANNILCATYELKTTRVCDQKSNGSPLLKNGTVIGLLMSENNLCEDHRNLIVFLRVSTYIDWFYRQNLVE